jgi:quercetin dioxygenase-like cupin family protein
MKEILEIANRIKIEQSTIDILLANQLIGVSNNKKDAVWSIEQLYQGEDCNFGFARTDVSGDKTFPFHKHIDSLEYLICISGSFILTIADITVRIMKTGDCASIPAGISHASRSLEEGTKLFYICVPKDKNFPRIEEKE